MRLYTVTVIDSDNRPMVAGKFSAIEAAQDEASRWSGDYAPKITEDSGDSRSFAVGRTYQTRSICDAEHIISVTVAKRTAKTITTTEGQALRIGEHEGIEFVRPWGRYSGSPVVRASQTMEDK